MNYPRCVFFLIGLLCIVMMSAFSQIGYEDYSNVFFYPHELEPMDLLQDGQGGPAIKITGKTVLVWVDIEPEMDFAHPTCYILISSGGIRIEKGKFWPVLNGKTILMNEISKYAFLSPCSLESDDASGLVDWIDIYIYPHELTLRDKLVDGLSGDQLKVYPNTLLIWVDLLPGAKFVHPTAYILVSKHGTRVEKGMWWPELNGKIICYGEKNKIGVVSPFKVMRLLLDSMIDE
ncbi:MAG: hypothetical protein JXB88_12295 [Spirochaetales bacterium]|nr:hypothetical protein [Spirochaetales bacterium]